MPLSVSAEVEALRRLNLRLGSELNERQYARAVVQAVIPALEARPASARVTVPAESRAWIDKTSTALVSHLRDSRYQVIGDLDDLIPAGAGRRSTSPSDDSDELRGRGGAGRPVARRAGGR